MEKPVSALALQVSHESCLWAAFATNMEVLGSCQPVFLSALPTPMQSDALTHWNIEITRSKNFTACTKCDQTSSIWRDTLPPIWKPEVVVSQCSCLHNQLRCKTTRSKPWACRFWKLPSVQRQQLLVFITIEYLPIRRVIAENKNNALYRVWAIHVIKNARGTNTTRYISAIQSWIWIRTEQKHEHTHMQATNKIKPARSSLSTLI